MAELSDDDLKLQLKLRAKPVATPSGQRSLTDLITGKKADAGMEDALGQSAMQGMTFGLSDEIEGGMMATQDWLMDKLRGKDADWSKSYDKWVTKARDRYKTAEEQHPVATFAGEAGGSIAAPLGVVGKGAKMVARTPGLTAKIVELAKTGGKATAAGASGGAAAGFGGGEGEDKRWNDAQIGALIGGTTGAVLPPLGSLAGAASKKIGRMLGWVDNEDVATRVLLKAIQDDGMSPAQAKAKLAAWASLGHKPEALFDLFGENTRGVAGAIAAMPGPSKQRLVDMIELRQAGQADRIFDDITNMGVPSAGMDFNKTTDALIKHRKTNADPLYKAAFAAKPVSSETIERILEDPMSKRAMRDGVETVMREGRATGKPVTLLDFGIDSFDPHGNPIFIGAKSGDPGARMVPNMRLLDATKRGLDDVLEDWRDKVTGRLRLDQKGRSVEMLRKAFVDELDVVNPAYGKARAAWAGPSAAIDALNMGRSIFKRDADITDKMISNLTPSEKEFFRIGFGQAVHDIVERKAEGSADIAKTLFGNPRIQKQVRQAFPDQASFDRFSANMSRELEMFKNAARVNPRVGSRTTPLMNAINDLDPDLVSGMIEKLSLGANWRYAVGAPIATAAKKAATGVRGPIANELSRMLTETDPHLRDVILQTLEDRLKKQGMRRQGGLRTPLMFGAGATEGGVLEP